MPQLLGQECEAPLTACLSNVFISSISYVQLIVQARAQPLFPRKTVCYGIIHILTPYAQDLTNLNPSLPMGAAPLLKVAINLEISQCTYSGNTCNSAK